MIPPRPCRTSGCTSLIQAHRTGVRGKVYCPACRSDRSAASVGRHVDRKAAGLVMPARTGVTQAIQSARLWSCEYLLTHPCVDCGEDELLTLQFDLRDRATWQSISEMVQAGAPIKNLQAAVGAYDVRCENCQAIKAAVHRGSYRLAYLAHIRIPLQSREVPPRSAGRPGTVAHWVSEVLKQNPCFECGEADIMLLEFDPKPGVDLYEDVEVMIKRSRSIEAIAIAIERCDVRCIRCLAVRSAKRHAYRRPFSQASTVPFKSSKAVVLPPPPTSTVTVKGPRGGVPPQAPQPLEFRSGAVHETEVPHPSSTDLPANGRHREAAPEQPSDRAPEVDVRDVATTVALGDPVREAATGGGDHHTVGAWEQARLQASLADSVVIGEGRRVRRTR